VLAKFGRPCVIQPRVHSRRTETGSQTRLASEVFSA